MIKIINNFITNIECDEFITFYKKNKDLEFSNSYDNIYHFNAINIIKKIDNFSFTKKLFKKINDNMELEGNGTLRIQHVDSLINIIEKPHRHTLPFSFVVFLNDEYGGGNLIFDNVIIKPKRGQLVYFCGSEGHYVSKVTNGDRYTLVSFLKKNIKFYKTNLI